VPSFASAVRIARRFEPDVLLVGWLEDTATAELVFEAARAGTLVLAGIASSTVGRLDDLGPEHALLVGYQTLRRICTSCRGAYYATADDLLVLGQDRSEAACRLLPRARGCGACEDSGFDGEIALCEVRGVTPPLAEQAAAICLEGMTTVEEVRRLAEATRAAPSRDGAAGASARA
jgi:type II secretory ATPase GspE/PulE/Tfp pilus assembly ATPase PilB-like protein